MEILSNLIRIVRTPAVVGREQRLRTEYPTKNKPPGWQTTDPQSHDPDNFRFIVHMTTKARLDNAAWLSAARRGESRRQHPNNEWGDLLTDFLSQNSISCTLVDELHRGTYLQDTTPHGFILDVPEENIVAIDPTDLGTPNHVQDKQTRKHILYQGIERKRNTNSAQDFFNNGVGDIRNEVLIDGIGPNRRQIRIAGIFLIVEPVLGIPLYEQYTRLSWSPREVLARFFTPGYWEEEKYQVNMMKKQYRETKDLAQLLRVPIIHIPAPLQI